ncbi:MAG: histidine kinase [Bacteroides sp.]|nr:histidine kinase [Bacteroides sp.]
MKIKAKYQKRELIIYVGIWTAVLLYPLLAFGEKAIDGDSLDWSELLRSYRNTIPFLVIFLINSLLLLPKLLFKGYTKRYIFAAITLLFLFIVYQYLDMPPLPKSGVRENIPLSHISTPDWLPDPKFHGDKPLRPPFRHPIPHSPHIISGPIVIDTIIAILILVAGAGIKAFLNNFRQEKKIAELENERLRNELNYLKAQLSPHFFMNILNNIHGMIELNPPKAQELVLKMSQLMRYVLYDSSAPLVALSKEMDFNRIYISLMKSRYSQKKVIIESSFPDKDKMKDKYLPPLLYIVFLENIFKHGISYRGQSFIKITFEIYNNHIKFCCINSINNQNKQNGKVGIGLKNVRKRLQMIYGNNFTLDKEQSLEYFRIILTIPLYDENKMHCC